MLTRLLLSCRRLSPLLVGMIIAVLGLFSQLAHSVPLTAQMLNQLNKLHDAKVSPDGRYLVYGLRQPGRGDHLFLLPLQGDNRQVRQLTSHASAGVSVQWHKNSDSVYFLTHRSGSSQVWKINIDGGEAVQVTDLPIDVNDFKLSPDNQKLLLALDVLPSCDNLKCTAKHQQTAAAHKTRGRVFDQLMVRHWSQWTSPYKGHLFIGQFNEDGVVDSLVRDLIPGWQTDVPAKPFSGMEDVTFSADSSYIVFAAKYPNRDHAWQSNVDLFKVVITDNGQGKEREIENLTEGNKAIDNQPVISSDGRFLAYLATKVPGAEADRFGLMIRDLRSGVVKEVAPLWDRSISSFVFTSDNRSVIVLAEDLGQRSLFEISTNFGDVKKIYANGSAQDVQLVGNTVYFVRHTLDHPKDVYAVNRDGDGFKQITDVNHKALSTIDFGQFEQFSFKGWNDETVYGYWIKPANFDPSKKYPIAFVIHGGPQGSFGNQFHPRWNGQLWAGAGFAVVMIDFHGSTGYGQAFTDSISRDWGGKPLIDLQKGLLHATKTLPWLDSDRACALGDSYGGYMVNWIASQWPDRFKCLVNHAGLFDMRSFSMVTEEQYFVDHEFGGPIWVPDTDYKKFNPADHVDQWKTPMLVIHGEKDFRVPLGQGLSAFTVLQRKSIPSKLIIYPDENHWVLNQDNLVQWYDEVFKWMKTYTDQ